MRWADVITENFRPGVLEKLGYSYEQCKAWNPSIIYAPNGGFGDRGSLGVNPWEPFFSRSITLFWPLAFVTVH